MAIVDGTGGDDDLTAEATALSDTIRGGDGFDRLAGLAGADPLFGEGSTSDIVTYAEDAEAGGTAAVVVDLAAGTATDGFGDTDTLSGFEKIEGTEFGDSLYGSEASWESYAGLAGDDLIVGRGGADRVSYVEENYLLATTSGVTVDLSAGTATDTFGDTDTLRGIEDVRGSSYADTITGNSENNQMLGLAGADSFTGGDGWDEVRYDQDVIFGGDAGITIDLVAGTITDGFGDTDTVTGVEAYRATNADDTIFGDAASDQTFKPLGGNDVVHGGDGTDRIDYSRDADYGGKAGVNVDL